MVNNKETGRETSQITHPTVSSTRADPLRTRSQRIAADRTVVFIINRELDRIYHHLINYNNILPRQPEIYLFTHIIISQVTVAQPRLHNHGLSISVTLISVALVFVTLDSHDLVACYATSQHVTCHRRVSGSIIIR